MTATTTTDIAPFAYDGHQVRVITDPGGEPRFVAQDVCDVLGITNSRDALSRLDEDEKGVGTTDTPGGPQQVSVLTEPGVYALAMTSRKPQAKPFVRWLSHDVVPTIRRTGQYGQPPALSGPELMAAALIEAQRTLDAARSQVKELEPKARSFDHFLSSGDDYSVATVAQALVRAGASTGRNRLFGFMEHLGWIYRPEGHRQWSAYQSAVEAGLVRVRMGKYEDQSTGEVRATYTIRVTPKGLDRLAGRFGVNVYKGDK